MDKKTISYKREWIPCEEAIEQFSSWEQLLGALKDGTIHARGRISSEYTAYEASDPKAISIKDWYDCAVVKNLDGNMQIPLELEWEEYSHPYPILHWYRDIEFFNADLDNISNINPALPAQTASKDKGGRPKKYDEKRFYAELAAMLYAGKIIPNNSKPWIDSENRKEIYRLSLLLTSLDDPNEVRVNSSNLSMLQAHNLPILENEDASPNDKTIRNYIDKFFDMFEEAGNYIKELDNDSQ